MTPAERLARLRLIRTPHVGPVSWHQLMQRFGSGEAALDALPELVLRGGAGKARIAPIEVAEAPAAEKKPAKKPAKKADKADKAE